MFTFQPIQGQITTCFVWWQFDWQFIEHQCTIWKHVKSIQPSAPFLPALPKVMRCSCMIRNLALSFGIRLSTSEPRPFLMSSVKDVGFMTRWWEPRNLGKFPCVISTFFHSTWYSHEKFLMHPSQSDDPPNSQFFAAFWSPLKLCNFGTQTSRIACFAVFLGCKTALGRVFYPFLAYSYLYT